MGTYIENVSPSDVRDFTGLSSSDVTDLQINTIMSGAVARLNSDILVRYDDWRVEAVDSWRENKVDGDNTTFYLPDDKRIIGDFDDSGTIDTSDVKAYVIEPDTSGSSSAYMKTDCVVSSIDDDEFGKFTLSAAPPSNGSLYVSWCASPLELETPHPKVKRAIIELTAALCYSRIDVGKVSKFRVGKVSVMQQSEGFKKYMSDYSSTVAKINSRIVRSKLYPGV